MWSDSHEPVPTTGGARRRPYTCNADRGGGGGGGGGGDGDPYSEVTYSDHGEPTFCGALGGMALGICLLFGATALLWFNEGSAVAASSGLLEAQSHYAAGTGGLTHVTGWLKGTQTGVRDSDHGIETPGSIWLERTPEMYQWKEVEHTTTRKVRSPGRSQPVTETTRTYTYDKVWSSTAIDSHRFKNPRSERRHNPPLLDALHAAGRELGKPFDGARWSQPVTLRGLSLAPSLLAQAEAPSEVGASVYAPGHGCSAAARGGGEPEVGCARLTWRHAPLGPTAVSVLGQRTAGSTLVPWRSSAREARASSGYELGLLMRGEHGAEAMFAAAASTNAAYKWGLRGGGALLVWVGWGLVLGPASFVASYVPLLSGLVGCMLGLVAAGLALVQALTIIALAWLFYRPLYAATLLALAVALLFGGGGALRRTHARGRPAAAAAGAGTARGAAAAAVAARAPPVASGGGGFCVHCGNALVASARFCSGCGAAAVPVVTGRPVD